MKEFVVLCEDFAYFNYCLQINKNDGVSMATSVSGKDNIKNISHEYESSH